MSKERIDKLTAHAEKLFDLFLVAQKEYAILRPIMADEKLIARISHEQRGPGFETIRHTLYWSFVQNLVQIVGDQGERTPSIYNLREHLTDQQVKAFLIQQYSVWAPSAKESDRAEIKELWKQRDQESEIRRRLEFDSIYDKSIKEAEELLKSPKFLGLKRVRNKLLAHNELQLVNGSYEFIDLRKVGLKYGEERDVLEKATRVFDDFFTLIKRTSFDWNDFESSIKHDAEEFWKDI